MKTKEAINIINQHCTDAAPDKNKEDLISASSFLVNKFGAASKAAEKTKASTYSIGRWARLSRLPDDILGYVYMGKIPVGSADIIRRLDSAKHQRLVTIVTIEESLNQEYIDLLQKKISKEEKDIESAIESVIGKTTSIRSVTLGFDQNTYIKLWAEAGRRRCTVGELCESLIHERIQQIREGEMAVKEEVESLQDISGDGIKSANKFIKKMKDIEKNLNNIEDNL